MTSKENNPGYLKGETFKTVIEHTPLISVDLIIKQDNKYLLGKRTNKPAKGYWFTLGGRIFKNETVLDAIQRIGRVELGKNIDISLLRFLGVFEHFYEDGIFDSVSTHYINLGYEIQTSSLEDLPYDQHSDYHWFNLEELMGSQDVHHYVKDYFRHSKGTVPQSQGEQ